MTRIFGIRCVLLIAVALLGTACLAARAEEPQLTEEQFREFLKTAKVVASQRTAKGVTAPVKLTLSDGQRTVVAAFQSIDEYKARAELPTGTVMNFEDSYKYNIAAYELAKLLGLGDMVPVTVEYKWRGNRGSLALWVPAEMDEQDRLHRHVSSPDVNDWNKQRNRMWVFSALVRDMDRNQTNMLITEDWKLVMIDFSRAFRPVRRLYDSRHLSMCDRELFERLQQLKEEEVLEATKPYLNKGRVRALLARRDKIVKFFETRIAEKGVEKVLY